VILGSIDPSFHQSGNGQAHTTPDRPALAITTTEGRSGGNRD
jgi:hypothetical protein